MAAVDYPLTPSVGESCGRIAGHAEVATPSCTLPFLMLTVDIQPELDPLAQLGPLQESGCLRCTLRSFLSGRTDLARYYGLRQISGVMESYTDIARFVLTRNTSALAARLRSLGAKACFEVVHAGHPPQLDGAPRLYILRDSDDDLFDATWRGSEDAESWVLVEPGEKGTESIVERILRARRTAGYRKFVVGYYAHSTAMEQFDSFCERERLAERWPQLDRRVRDAGVSSPGLMMPVPACAALQWRPNVVLERLQAKLDLHFRRLDGVSSMMCPENVSGYSLTNTTRAFLFDKRVRRLVLSVRFENYLAVF